MGEQPGLVVVTGASRGVGRATALALAQDHRCSVLAISRDEKALASLFAEHSGSAGDLVTLALDITSGDAAQRVKKLVGGRRVLALVHNAGLLRKRPLGQYDRKDLEEIFASNVFAPLELTQALLDELEGDPPGHVVHIGSMGGYQDSVKFGGLVAYSSSKAALACMSQCLAEELKDRSIRSNCLALGSVDTEMLRAAFPGYRSTITPATMGEFIARFALEGHKLFNGKVLPVASTTP